ncbi:DUF2164 domain-containing protein [Rhizobium yanglingense]
MKPIDFSKDDKAALIARIQHFFDKELDQPVGLLKSELVLDFFAKEIGAGTLQAGAAGCTCGVSEACRRPCRRYLRAGAGGAGLSLSR